jgi:hypothetical protein
MIAMTLYPLELLGLMVVAWAIGCASLYLFAMLLVHQDHREIEEVLERSRNAKWSANERNQP